MKIAIYFDNDQLQGGAFNYALTIIRILENEKFKNHEFILITDSKKNFDFLNNTNFKVYFLKKSFNDELYYKFSIIIFIKKFFIKFKLFNNI